MARYRGARRRSSRGASDYMHASARNGRKMKTLAQAISAAPIRKSIVMPKTDDPGIEHRTEQRARGKPGTPPSGFARPAIHPRVEHLENRDTPLAATKNHPR